MYLNIISIFLGSGIGAAARFLINSNMSKYYNFPISTFLVNIIGSFIIGFLYVFFMNKTGLNPALKLALTVGFCGGLTTFSTFSLELFELFTGNQIFEALIYIVLSVTICVLMTAIGVYFAKFI